MKTIVGSGIVAALMMMMPAGTALAGGTASADGYTSLDDVGTADTRDQPSQAVATASSDELGSADEVGAGGGEPGRMSVPTRDDPQPRAEDVAHEAWLNSIWTGP